MHSYGADLWNVDRKSWHAINTPQATTRVSDSKSSLDNSKTWLHDFSTRFLVVSVKLLLFSRGRTMLLANTGHSGYMPSASRYGV